MSAPAGLQGIGGTTVADETPTATTETSEPPKPDAGAGRTVAQDSPASITLTREELERQLLDAQRKGEKGALNAEELKALRAKAKRLDEIEESSKTELQKAIDRAAKAEAERNGLAEKYRSALIRSAFTSAAVERGLKGQQLADAITLADLGVLELDDDGAVKGVDRALEAVLKDRPYLLPTSGSENGAGQGERRAAPNINATDHGTAATHEQRVQQAMAELASRGGFQMPR